MGAILMPLPWPESVSSWLPTPGCYLLGTEGPREGVPGLVRLLLGLQRASVLAISPGHVGGTCWGLGSDGGTVAQSSALLNKSLDGQGIPCGEITNLNRKCKQFGWNPRMAV